jgi:putative transposase
LWRFDSLLEARVIIEDQRVDYDMNSPHTAQDDLTPTDFAAQSRINNQPQVA